MRHEVNANTHENGVQALIGASTYRPTSRTAPSLAVATMAAATTRSAHGGHMDQRRMMAVVVDEFGPPSVLKYREVDVVPPGTGEVVVEVHAVSVNRTLDLAVRADGDGRDVHLPLVLGVDPTGLVHQTGPEVKDFTRGDRVAVVANRCSECPSCRSGRACEHRFHPGVDRWGGYAQFVTVPAWSLTRVPDGLEFPQATVVFRHYPTAHHLLRTVARLTRGECVLVLGAAGGLGSACVEVANALGASVIAGAGAKERVDAARTIGAQFGIDYRAEDLAARVWKVTEGSGVDVVVDNIGDPSIWPSAFSCLRRNGRLVTAGAHGGGLVTLDLRRLYQNHLEVLGSSGKDHNDLEWVITQAANRRFHPLIGAVLPLSQARKAHEMVEANRVVGKVILDPTRS